MREIDDGNLADYLRQRGLLERDEPADILALAGGVSNVVLRASTPRGDMVVKQSRVKLRTQADWFSRLERIYREADVLRTVEPLLPPGAVPRILFEDRENYLFVMDAIPPHSVWKTALLAGSVDPEIARVLGDYLSTIHGETAGDERLAGLLGDRTVFDELRVDPYYRHLARAHADLRSPIERLIDNMSATTLCVVHADFSPKNVLVIHENAGEGTSSPAIALVDFETGHYGDPAFDLGFFLTHLFLKAVARPLRAEEYFELATAFWRRYVGGLESSGAAALIRGDLEGRAVLHLGACMLARVDGKSPVDYLNDPPSRDLVRQFCRRVLLDPPGRIADTIEDLRSAIASLHSDPGNT